MKKVIVLLLVAVTMFTGCKKDKEEPAPNYTKSQLMGKWKQTSPNVEVSGTPYLVFSETEMTFTDKATANDDGYELSLNYTFDGKAFKYLADDNSEVTNTINELTSTKLVTTVTMKGEAGSEKFTFTKVQ